MPQQEFTDEQRAAARKAVEIAPELCSAVAHTAVVLMLMNEELPAVTLPVDEIETVLAQGLAGAPTVVDGQVVAEIIPRPLARLGPLERQSELSRLFRGGDWTAMSEAVRIAWEQHCPGGLALPSDTPTPPRATRMRRSGGWAGTCETG